jgi:SAM-dependent methyltransferase
MSGHSLDEEYFNRVYAAKDDPWDFATSEYEKAKYAQTLEALPREHYANVLEIGCSIGILTAQLAPRCGHLLSVDVSAKALELARERCREFQNVELRRMSVPNEFPGGRFDLVLVSEVGYYFSPPDRARLADRIAEHQSHGSDLLLVHFTPKVEDYPATGDQVHDYFRSRPEWDTIASGREERYRLDVLRRRAA